MKINKILNTNAVLVTDNQGQEKIAMGKGLAFGKKVGTAIDVAKVEKLYGLDSTASYHLLESFPQEILDVADFIVTQVKERLNSKVSDTLFVAIADHINGAVIRSKENINMTNFLLWDVKNFFDKEYKLGREAVDLIATKMQVELTDDEVGFIALHIVSASLDNTNSSAENLLKLMEEILTVIKYSSKLVFDENEFYFQRFKTHLKFFSERVLNKKQNKGSFESNLDIDMFDIVKSRYPQSFDTAEKVSAFIETHYGYKISSDEQFYLMVHLSRILKSKK